MNFWTFSLVVQAGLSLFSSPALATPVERSTATKPAFFLAGDSTTAIDGGKDSHGLYWWSETICQG